jgi:hypothetical protein
MYGSLYKHPNFTACDIVHMPRSLSFDVLQSYGGELESQAPFVLARSFGDPPMFIYYDYYIYWLDSI